MSNLVLFDLLQLLNKLKQDKHGTADTRTNRDIDQAIYLVTKLIETEAKASDPETYQKLLNLLGVILEKAPSIVAFIKLLSG